MTTAGGSGYYVRWVELQRQAQVVDEERDFLGEVRAALNEAFQREGNPLGDDQYGAQFQKNLTEMKTGIFDAFDAYIGEVGSVSERLRENAANYERAEQANDPEQRT
ncbi:hypothetical protein IMZ11_20845 [Microtetraspora sp. AC03309]|uniref:hypothetical protein n=1 Tax=Microtetraspora sp. AC03309 TaxID=2779376 RepID=UPI001E2FD62F|nr:hypothetical protein [Microtetraspora sp. AC03309]MCC5578079.1 hypothetical protein [Microtetraspora sp. AC03309]